MEQILSCAPAIRIFDRLLRGFDGPPALRLWNDALHVPSGSTTVFTLVLRDPRLLRRLVFERSAVLLADAYFRGALDVEGDLYAALQLKGHFESISLSWRDKLALLLDALRLPGSRETGFKPAGSIASRLARRFSHCHSRDSDHAAIAFHYDVSNGFYGLWLDQERVYSCAYFESAHDSLEQAQRNKLEYICRKLRLHPGERLLDIGCGWGALVCWAARHHGVHAHGITLSRQQLAYAQERIRTEGLEGLVTVELRDNRDLPTDAVYDKVASVGMFEHVGLANLPTYLSTVQRVLRPGGLFLNHGMANREAAVREVNEPTYRVWRLYMAACALEFEAGGTGIYQILASRRHRRRWPAPLSRGDLHAARC